MFRTEFLPLDPPNADAVRFWGSFEQLKLLGSGLYVLRARQQKAAAEARPYLYTRRQLENMSTEWIAHTPRREDDGFSRRVPLELGVAVARGMMVMGGELDGHRAAWNLTEFSPVSDRHIDVSRVLDGLAPLTELIEAGKLPAATLPDQG